MAEMMEEAGCTGWPFTNALFAATLDFETGGASHLLSRAGVMVLIYL
jgi:hypothetical protein